jgi:hypothetical protein
MKSAVAASLALLFGSVTLSAQSATQNQTQTSVYRMPITSGGCPVSLRALHGADGSMLRVDKNRPAGIAQLLHLILSNPDARQVVAARVRVRGLSGRGRMTQTSGQDATQGGADVTRSLEARFSAGSDKDVSSDVWVSGMTAVLEVELNSVTFADGTTRRFAGVDACRIAPEPLMLIAGR